MASHIDNPIIAIWGLTYKPNTHSTRNSPALALIEHLKPFDLQVFDPVASASTLEHRNLRESGTPLDACRGADALVIMTPWKDFRDQSPDSIAIAMQGKVVIDPYKALDGHACRVAGLHYITLGTSG